VRAREDDEARRLSDAAGYAGSTVPIRRLVGSKSDKDDFAVRLLQLRAERTTPNCAPRSWRKRPKGGQRSYRQIAAELFQAGYQNANGRAFSASSIKAMLD
jgi:hypothetical protein